MKGFKKVVTSALAAVLSLSLAACGQSASTQATASAAASDTVNIGVTDTLSTLNPLNMDMTFVNYYATSFEFLPLISLDKDYQQYGMIADPITTDDNLTFHIHIKDDAKWSDGQDITADDVIWTILKMTAPAVANPYISFANVKGISDDNLSPEGADSLEGLVKTDDKNLDIVMKSQMGLNTFLNNIGTWLLILPKHALEDTPDDELLTSDWFNAPTVVSGPYKATSEDFAHYVTYEANENYFAGAPKIAKMNIRIEDSSSLLAGLQSGEIDMTHPAFSNMPVEDRKTLEGLSNVTTTYSDPITDEMTFFNTKNVPDAKVRLAIVEAIDRNTILDQILGGKGEIVDGFVGSHSPYYDSSKPTIPYDPDNARKLLEEAGWDSSKSLEWYVSSSDTSMTRAVQVIKEELAQVGVTININTVDFSTLMSTAASNSFDIFSVQYTITPSDYYTDGTYLVDADDSWTGGWKNDEVDALFAKTQETTDTAELTSIYLQLDEILEQEVPLFSLYFMSNSGSVNNRIKNASPTFFGAFNNIQDWEIAQ